MTNPVCRDCGKECVWGKTKAGARILYDLGPPHFVRCLAKNGVKPKKAPSGGHPLTKAEEASVMLREMGYKDAKDLLRDIPEGEPADMVLAALKRKGGE